MLSHKRFGDQSLPKEQLSRVEAIGWDTKKKKILCLTRLLVNPRKVKVSDSMGKRKYRNFML